MTVSLDKTVGGELDLIISAAVRRYRESLDTAKKLAESEYYSPAFVWAVRSVEIFIKEVILLPLYLERLEGDWDEAWRQVRLTFRSGKWGPALNVIDQEYGPLDAMVTDDGRDVWTEWKSKIVSQRGDVVHGAGDANLDNAKTIIVWAEMITMQVTLRLIAAKKHPLHDLFTGLIAAVASSSGE